MKKLKNVWVLLGIVLTTCGLCLYYTIDSSAKTIEKINEIQLFVASKQENSARQKANALSKEWKSKQFFLSIIAHHENLEKIEESIEIMKTSLTNIDNEYSDFWVSSTQALSSLENLRNIEIPTIENIL